MEQESWGNIELIKEVLNLIKENKVEMLEFNVTESKISIDFKNVVSEKILGTNTSKSN